MRSFIASIFQKSLIGLFFSYSVQFNCSVVSDSLQPHGRQASLSITNFQSLLKLMSIDSVMPSNHLILCCPLLPPSIFPSIRVFSSESVPCIRWSKYWSFSFSISPSNECLGLISFRMDWLDIQGTLKSLLQHHGSKASILWRSVTQLCPSLCDPTDCSMPDKLMSVQSVMPSNHLIFCCPLLPPSIFPSIRVFSNESALCVRWPQYWSFSFKISPSNEYSGLIFFKMDWLDDLAVQGTLKSLLQHHSSKTSILWHSAFFTVQLSHPYMTTGKTIASTGQNFWGKVMSLLFNMLPRLVITVLPRSKCLLISWLQSPSAVILELPKIKSVSVSTVSPFICHEVMGPDMIILVF